MNIRSFIQRHQLVSYFVLAYGITWGNIFVFLGSRGFQLSAIQPQEFPIIFLFMLLGPSTSSLTLTALLGGRSGFRNLWQRLTRWHVNVKWYAAALLTIPVLTLIILSVASVAVSPAFVPQFNIIGLMFGLLAGALEEIGWTGFATPRLLKTNSVLRAGFLLGVLWACWHILADFTFNFAAMGPQWVIWLLTFWIAPLIAYRILMTWVYSHARSLLVGQLMHASYTGWLFVLSPQTTFNQNVLWQSSLALSLWALALIVAMFNLRQQSRHQHRVVIR